MSLLITIAGVWLGLGYLELVNRRFALTDRGRWLLLAPVWALYVVVLLTTDTSDPVPRAVQAFALATLLRTMLDVARALWHRRNATSAPRARADGDS